MAMPDSTWMHVDAPVELRTTCSWCGAEVRTKPAQETHVRWHRALGVVPLHPLFEADEPFGR